MQTDNLISLQEAAEIMGVTVMTIRSYMDRGLETVKVGRLRKTTRKALQEFIEREQKVNGPPINPEVADGLMDRHGIQV